jgi:hypothetical protein
VPALLEVSTGEILYAFKHCPEGRKCFGFARSLGKDKLQTRIDSFGRVGKRVAEEAKARTTKAEQEISDLGDEKKEGGNG